jgi:hypothetical protein
VGLRLGDIVILVHPRVYGFENGSIGVMGMKKEKV